MGGVRADQTTDNIAGAVGANGGTGRDPLVVQEEFYNVGYVLVRHTGRDQYLLARGAKLSQVN